MSAAQTPKLTPAAIVDAAIEVADADGLAALSMRRVADHLDVGAMSLYRHVADKDALLKAMAEEVGRRFPYPVREAGPWTWRERVAIAVDTDWELYRRHSWVVLAYAAPRYSFGVASLEGLDWLATGFLDLGVDITEAVQMALSVWGYVSGIALTAASEQLLGADAPEEQPGGLAELIDGCAMSANVPHLADLTTAPGSRRLTDARAMLDVGVGYLCDGFAAAAPAE